MKQFYLYSVLFLCNIIITGSCKKEAKTLPPCESEFMYQGSPFRVTPGDATTVMPTYNSGEGISGIFKATTSGIVINPENGKVDLAATTPGSYTIRKVMVGNTTCGNRISLGYLTVLPPPQIFSNGEETTGWNGSNWYLDTKDKKEGNASIKSTIESGNYQDLLFNRATPLDAKVDKQIGQLRFWFYISDPFAFDQNTDVGQFELTSSGQPDQQELTWGITPSKYNFKPGWNFLVLKFSEAGLSSGDVDFTKLNFFRVYMFNNSTTYPLTIGVDDLQIWGN